MLIDPSSSPRAIPRLNVNASTSPSARSESPKNGRRRPCAAVRRRCGSDRRARGSSSGSATKSRSPRRTRVAVAPKRSSSARSPSRRPAIEWSETVMRRKSTSWRSSSACWSLSKPTSEITCWTAAYSPTTVRRSPSRGCRFGVAGTGRPSRTSRPNVTGRRWACASSASAGRPSRSTSAVSATSRVLDDLPVAEDQVAGEERQQHAERIGECVADDRLRGDHVEVGRRHQALQRVECRRERRRVREPAGEDARRRSARRGRRPRRRPPRRAPRAGSRRGR